MSVWLYMVNENLVTWPPHPLIKCTSFVPNTKKGGRAHWTTPEHIWSITHTQQLVNKRASAQSFCTQDTKEHVWYVHGSFWFEPPRPSLKARLLNMQRSTFFYLIHMAIELLTRAISAVIQKGKKETGSGWYWRREWKLQIPMKASHLKNYPIHVYTQWRAAGYTVLLRRKKNKKETKKQTNKVFVADWVWKCWIRNFTKKGRGACLVFISHCSREDFQAAVFV